MANSQPRYLADYACHAESSRGRLHDEPASPTRSPYQRDRDRIVHSAAFRRLKFKTQVFVFHEGDHYRTRLTHSLEVAQIARSIARNLDVDEDLTEALALAHDLGHPPFGHAGETALDHCMRDHGGFDHNVQSVRMVTALECRYADFDGLNLTWETLEGLIKHNGPLDSAAPYRTLLGNLEIDADSWPSLEAQIAATSDDIAYDSHDLDDGLRAGLFSLADIATLPLLDEILDGLQRKYPGLEQPRLIHETLRRLITLMIEDVTRECRTVLEEQAPSSVDDIRNLGRPTAGFSPAMADAQAAIKEFLRQNMYAQARIARIMRDAGSVLSELFHRYLADDGNIPEEWRSSARRLHGSERARLICDFIAGMTDRFALGEHRRLFDATPELR